MTKRYGNNTRRRSRRISQANAGGAQRLAPELVDFTWHVPLPHQVFSAFVPGHCRADVGFYEIAARDDARYCSDERGPAAAFSHLLEYPVNAWTGKRLR